VIKVLVAAKMIALNRMLKPRSRTDNTLVLNTLCYENGLTSTDKKGFMMHQDAGPIFMYPSVPTAHVVSSESSFLPALALAHIPITPFLSRNPIHEG
jgi:hypothetical protein